MEQGQGDRLEGYEFDVWFVMNGERVVQPFLSREDAEGYSRGYVPVQGTLEIVARRAGVTDASGLRKQQSVR